MLLPKRLKQLLPARCLVQGKALKEYWMGSPDIRLLKTLVDPARNSLDIGAAEGIYTYFLARLSRHVDAYEPDPQFYAFLSAAALRNATVHNIAASDRNGEAILSIPVINAEERPWLGTLTPLTCHDNFIRIPVQARRLDEMGHTDVGFIKIDVEGHEASVLRGAAALIAQYAPTMLIEIEQRHIQCDISSVFTFIRDMGYSGFFLWEGSIQKLDRFDVEEHQRKHVSNPESRQYINNFIFIPNRMRDNAF